ncbi:MAG: hypothetical protein LBJ01_07095 [Tannerella sp.]|jgi:hypothetical protein|nr:hypothetical protein [Tannerella sp.]
MDRGHYPTWTLSEFKKPEEICAASGRNIAVKAIENASKARIFTAKPEKGDN